AAVKKRMSPRRNDNNVHDKTFRDGSFLKIGWPSVNIMSSSDSRRHMPGPSPCMKIPDPVR
ncbi:TPA: phage terminase large subunit family protein, partial [Escherichia coli]|nr:phage terminase large subunit family protein [Escherichia coli]